MSGAFSLEAWGRDVGGRGVDLGTSVTRRGHKDVLNLENSFVKKTQDWKGDQT